jgi:hypothetical protein
MLQYLWQGLLLLSLQVLLQQLPLRGLGKMSKWQRLTWRWHPLLHWWPHNVWRQQRPWGQSVSTLHLL